MKACVKSKAHWLVFAASGVALAALFACAKGEAVADDGVLSPDAQSTCSCTKNETCKDGKCVSPTIDSDSDGVTALQDCDDNDPTVHPGATEVCNGKDDDCDGQVDNGIDHDGDGFYACGTGDKPVDCDDDDPAVHPGVTAEVCNGKDDDCNGKVDEIPVTLNPTLTDTHWKLAGSPTPTIVGDWAQLTSNAVDQVGGLLWKAAYTFDSFEASLSFKVGVKTEPADGLAFVWLKGTNVVVGEPGRAFGAGGLVGYGVAIDTYRNTEDNLDAPFLSVIKTNTNPPGLITAKKLSNVADGGEHTLRIVLKAGKLNVFVDTTQQLKDFAIPGYAPFEGYWGVTASTGGFSGTHSVRGITMAFPEGQGCVP